MINFPVSDWMPDAKIPSGPIQDKWSKYKLESKLINPNNKRKYTVLVVGSGLAGASAAATLAAAHAVGTSWQGRQSQS